MSTILNGAWELISESQKGMAIFTDTHYSIVVTDQSEPDSGEIAGLPSLTTAGTYRVSDTDSVVIFDPVASPGSGQAGATSKWQLSVIGSKAKTRKIGPKGSLQPAEVWQKVS